MRKAGFVRVRVDGEVLDVEAVGELAPRKNHQIEAVVDRIVIREGVDARLAESDPAGAGARRRGGAGQLSRQPREPNGAADGRAARPPGTSSFSARSTPARIARSASRSWSRARSASTVPTVRAPAAKAWAAALQFDPELVLPDESLSLADGRDRRRGRVPRRREMRSHKTQLRDFLKSAGFDWNIAARDAASRGCANNCCTATASEFLGVLTLLEKEYATAMRAGRARAARSAFAARSCARSAAARGCGPRPARVAFGGLAIHEITAMAVSQARAWFACARRWPSTSSRSPGRSGSEIDRRLEFLEKVGVDYLTLDRPGRHAQRRRVAARAAGDRHRLGPGRRLLRARRAFDRPAPARQSATDRRPAAICRSRATPCWSSSTTKPSCAAPITWSTWAPAPGCTAGGSSRKARPSEVGAQSRLAHRPVSVGRAIDSRARAAPPSRQDALDHDRRRDDQQSQERRRRGFRCRRAGVRDRRERLGQEFAGERNAGPGAGAAAGRRRGPSRARIAACAA